MNSGMDREKNLKTALRLCRDGAESGAQFLLLPEMFHYLVQQSASSLSGESIDGDTINNLRNLARELKVWILGGSLCERTNSGSKPYNSSTLIDADGQIQSIYRKIHLFDFDLGDKSIRESDMYRAGETPVIGDVNGVKVGMAICYDLRFPELFRHYASNGAKIMTLPSSFTKLTGEAHWEVLVRARAIENQCFFLAPNQVGIGTEGVPTYGNSLVVDPWGNVLARGSGEREQIVSAELDFTFLEDKRKALPALKHRKLP